MRYLVIKGSDIVNVINADEDFVAQHAKDAQFVRSDTGEIGDGWDGAVVAREKVPEPRRSIQDVADKLREALEILRAL